MTHVFMDMEAKEEAKAFFGFTSVPFYVVVDQVSKTEWGRLEGEVILCASIMTNFKGAHFKQYCCNGSKIRRNPRLSTVVGTIALSPWSPFLIPIIHTSYLFDPACPPTVFLHTDLTSPHE
jgi:hypothetical protein